MKEKDIFEEIIDIGKKRGKLTYDEINEALPSEFYTPEELEDLMDLLQDMGVEIVDREEGAVMEEEIPEEEEEVETEKTEDLVQAYFHSMGNITILSKDAEIELAKRLEEGRRIIRETVMSLPLYSKIEASIEATREGEEVEEEEGIEEEKPDEALNMSLRVFEALMRKVEKADQKVSPHGSLKELKKKISTRKTKDARTQKLMTLAK
jgi:RNA polymerase primary sigma factor